jgi:hypothetical protein
MYNGVLGYISPSMQSYIKAPKFGVGPFIFTSFCLICLEISFKTTTFAPANNPKAGGSGF